VKLVIDFNGHLNVWRRDGWKFVEAEFVPKRYQNHRPRLPYWRRRRYVCASIEGAAEEVAAVAAALAIVAVLGMDIREAP
jgi:hypothetical protein